MFIPPDLIAHRATCAAACARGDGGNRDADREVGGKGQKPEQR